MDLRWHPAAREELRAPPCERAGRVIEGRETALKLSLLQTHEEVLAEELRDPEFRAEWDRLTLARAVGQCVMRYRVQNSLSQRKLAQILGIRQPQVARLEAGMHDPSFATLRLLSEHLGMEFLVDISPRPTRWIKSRPRAAMLFEEAELSTGTRVAVAARWRNSIIARL